MILPDGGKPIPKNLIHHHLARPEHWDLRLEVGRGPQSWAVPKEQVTDPKVKRLAVMVEDHALEYGDFEGIIPEGQYGAGEVRIRDAGSDPESRAPAHGRGPASGPGGGAAGGKVCLRGLCV